MGWVGKSSGGHGSKHDPYDYTPAEDLDAIQGWNTCRNRFLAVKGHARSAIEAFDKIVRAHVHGEDVNARMEAFINENYKLIKDISQFELASMRRRSENAIRYAQRSNTRVLEALAFYRAHKNDPAYPYDKTWLRNTTHDLSKIPKAYSDLSVYRKGGVDKTLLSWTTNRDGVSLTLGHNFNVQLTPDRKSTVGTLARQGIVPIGGIGASFNHYAGESSEVLFVKLPSRRPR